LMILCEMMPKEDGHQTQVMEDRDRGKSACPVPPKNAVVATNLAVHKKRKECAFIL